MRKLAFVAGLLTLAALPASAATERIPLQFIRAADMERSLIAAPREPGTGGLGGAPTPRGYVPEGVTLLTTATTANELVVDGTPEGIEKVRQLVRLMDVPARKVKFHVRVFPDRLLQNEFADVPEARENHVATALSEKEVARLVKNGPAPLVDLRLDGEANLPVRVYWPTREQKSISATTITSRLAGPERVRVQLSAGAALPARGEGSVMLEPTAEAPYLVYSVPDADVVLILHAAVSPVRPARATPQRRSVRASVR